MTVDIVPMDLGHYGQAHELWRRTEGISLTETDSREGIDRYLRRNPGMCFVALEEGRLVGTILGGHDGRRGYVTHLAVDAACRGKGIGSALVERCVEALKAEGMPAANLFVLADNVAGRRFWEAHGWQWPDTWGVMNRKF
jgi:N-acetylglutamate synthase